MIQNYALLYRRGAGKNGVERAGEGEREKQIKRGRVCRRELRMVWVEKGTIEKTPENI
jgi:hypothetical protein